MDVNVVDRIIAAGNDVASVKDDILAVTGDSLLGYRMFGHHLCVLDVAAYTEFLEQEITRAGHTLTLVQFNEITQKCAVRAQELQIDESNPEPRVFKCVYDTLEIHLPANNAAHQCENRLRAREKELTVKHHQLKQVWYEKAVLGVPTQSAQTHRSTRPTSLFTTTSAMCSTSKSPQAIALPDRSFCAKSPTRNPSSPSWTNHGASSRRLRSLCPRLPARRSWRR